MAEKLTYSYTGRYFSMSYSFENTMYGTLGPERTVWDEEANEAVKETVKKNS